MIVEHRTYGFRPGTLKAWLSKYESEGLPIQKKHLSRFLGLWVTEIGPMHRTIMMWEYDSLADREARRAALDADPAWSRYIGEIWQMNAIETQDVIIMREALPPSA